VDRPSLEAIVLYLTPEGIRHLSPHGRETLRADWEPALDPTESIVDAVANLGLAPAMAHSTSWRVVRRQLVLTFLVSVDAPRDLPGSFESELVSRVALARGRATGPPPEVHLTQVVEHGLRHLAWLVGEDETIRAAMPGWPEALVPYAPEPFRAFTHDPSA
jgi:hypothetical protein